MSPFYATQEFSIQQRIASSKANVLAQVHDPNTVLNTNPVLTSVIPDPTAPAGEIWYTVVEKVPVVGSIETSTSFRVQWIEVPDGTDMEVYADLGTRLSTRLRVTEVGNGEVEYTDHCTVTGLFLALPFIVSRAMRSHNILKDIIVAKSAGGTTF